MSTQVEVVSRHNRSRFPQTCQRWIDNAVMYSGMGMDTLNYYHTLFDSFGMVFNLVASLNLFNMSDMLARSVQPCCFELLPCFVCAGRQ